MTSNSYSDIIVTKKGQIGIIKFNRPKALNSFGGNLVPDTIAAFRELDNDPDTVFTVLTGEGRFFSAGADVKAISTVHEEKFANDGEKKIAFVTRFAPSEYHICSAEEGQVTRTQAPLLTSCSR